MPVLMISTYNNQKSPAISQKSLDLAKQGNGGAFTEIYNGYFEKIYRFIYYRTSHKETAEDLAEEVFVKVYAKIGSVSSLESFEGWLYKIARNLVIDFYRSKKTETNLSEVEHLLEYESTIISDIDLDFDQKFLLGLLRKLPPDQQQVLKLKFFEDLPNSAIAELLGKTEGAIRVIQHRAIIKLQAIARSEGILKP